MRGGIPPLPVVIVVCCLIAHKDGCAFVLREFIQGFRFNLFVVYGFFFPPVSRIRKYRGGRLYDVAVSDAWVMTWYYIAKCLTVAAVAPLW